MRPHRIGVFCATTALAIAAACSSFDSDTTSPPPDASDDVVTIDGGVDGGGGGDAEPKPPTCKWDAPWNTPAQIFNLNSDGGQIVAATLTADEQTMVISRLTPPDPIFHLWFSERSDAGKFEKTTRLSGSPLDQVYASLTPNGDRIFYGEYIDGGTYDIRTAARRDGGTFGFEAPSALVQGAGAGTSNEITPFITASGKTLYFTSTSINVAKPTFRIFRTPYPDQGVFGSLVDELSADGGSVSGPLLSPDELTIWFTGGYATDQGIDGEDIYVAHREAVTDKFGTPKPVTELNTPSTREGAGWISPDGCRMYIITDRTGIAFEVFLATRTPTP